jgi:hypothetical protein
MDRSESINKLAKALVAVQGMITGAEKGSENPFFHSKYADLEACWKAVKDPLQANGLAVVQLVGECDANGSQGLTTMLLHESGEFISQYSSIPVAKKDPHGAGSGITYLRRYGLSAILGLLQVDDDGNDATGKKKPVKQSSQPVAKELAKESTKEERELAKDVAIRVKLLIDNGFEWKAHDLVYAEDSQVRIGIWNELGSDTIKIDGKDKLYRSIISACHKAEEDGTRPTTGDE